ALAGTRERAGYFPLVALAPLGAGALDGVAALDCVCIDDLQQVIGRRDWERALFNLYREMDETSRRLVVAADAPPVGLPWALPDLGSRCGASAIFALQELNEDEQAQALRRHAQARGLELPDETVRFLQRRFPRATARLCEILDTLDDASLSAQRRITVPFIREVLSD
ncbi:MAG: DnaA/Hda family protein, partial [Steroidobacteraceae bacterium]